MIKCEWGNTHLPHSSMKQCPYDAKYVIVFKNGHPMVVPFHDYNFVCEEHLKQLRRRRYKMEIYEFTEYNEKVQFT